MLKDTSLLYFYEVARCGSIRQAAERLHVSPSAISRMITKAEHQFQTELFERRAKGMNLTEAGRILAEQMRGVLTQLDDARARIDELRGLRRGDVRVHCIEGVVLNVVPGAVSAYNALHPGVRFRINVASTDGIVEALLSDESDVGIAFNLRRRAGIEVLHAFSEPIHVLAGRDHPLARERRVTLRHLVRHPIAMPDQSFGVRNILDRALEASGLACAMLVTTNSVALTRSLARSGAAVTLMPPFAASPEVESGDVRLIPIADARLPPGTASICKREGRRLPAAAAEFVDQLRRQFEALLKQPGSRGGRGRSPAALRSRRTSGSPP